MRMEEGAMLADHFTQIFREEHRSVRDTLLDLIRAFGDRDKRRINLLLHSSRVDTPRLAASGPCGKLGV